MEKLYRATGEQYVRQRRFVKLFDTAIERIVADELTGSSLRVLLYIMSQCGYDNVARIPQQDIVDAVGASRQQVSAALKVLSAKGYVIVNTTKRPGFYKVSEAVAQRGIKEST